MINHKFEKNERNVGEEISEAFLSCEDLFFVE